MKKFVNENRSLLLAIFIAATLLASVYYIQFYFHYQVARVEFPWIKVFIGHFGTYYIFSLLSISIIILAKRIRLIKAISFNTAIHLLSSIAFALLFLLFALLYNRSVGFSTPNLSFLEMYKYDLTHNLQFVILGYWTVIGVTYSFEYHKWHKISEGERIGLLEQHKNENQFLARILLKEKGVTKVIELEEVQWIEAFDNYMKLHDGDKFYLIRKTMTSISANLNPNLFCRVHRSFIVNLTFIASINRMRNGDAVASLRSGAEVRVSRKFRQDLEVALTNLTPQP